MWQIITNNWGSFLTGFWNTILSSIIALVFSLILGVIFALLEVAPSKFGQVIAKIYIAIFRNIPLLVIVMIFYLIVPRYIVKLSGFQAGTIGLTLYTSAFIAETVRAGINSNGRCSLQRYDLCASHALCHLTSSDEDSDSTTRQPVCQLG